MPGQNMGQQPFQRLPFVSMAGGGTVRQPSFALVGERGPELALLQRGSVILPAQAATQAMSQLGTTPPGLMDAGLPPQVQAGIGNGIGPQVSQVAQAGGFGPNGMSDFVRSLLLSRLPAQALNRPSPPVAPPAPPALPPVPTLPAQANPQAIAALVRRRRARRFEGGV